MPNVLITKATKLITSHLNTCKCLNIISREDYVLSCCLSTDNMNVPLDGTEITESLLVAG